MSDEEPEVSKNVMIFVQILNCQAKSLVHSLRNVSVIEWVLRQDL